MKDKEKEDREQKKRQLVYMKKAGGGWYFLWVPDKTDCRKRDNIYHRTPFRLVNINMYFVMQGQL